MAGFKKAKAEQAALKIGMYGAPGSGKSFTSLLIAEGLANLSGKRIAYVDTEHGTDFYCKAVPSRKIHPEAFDFDALYTRSLTEISETIYKLKPEEYSVVVIDSITHLWEAARAAYSGKTTSVGTIPMHAWAKIKKPYKELLSYLLSSPLHVILCGRQGVDYEQDEDTDELKAVGYKMKAEGETPYEPHILFRMEAIKPKKTNEVATIVAYAEKDRTGILAGRTFVNPNFKSLCAPIMGLLGGSQAQIMSENETSVLDAERLTEIEKEKEIKSEEILREFSAKLDLCKDTIELKALSKNITPELKSKMLPSDVVLLREKYQERELKLTNGKLL